MDSLNTHNLTNRERIELQSKIQRLEWLLRECIGIEEYELCHQIQRVIQRKYELLSQTSSDSSAHYETTNNSTNEIE
jgi:hypothetical protein